MSLLTMWICAHDWQHCCLANLFWSPVSLGTAATGCVTYSRAVLSPNVLMMGCAWLLSLGHPTCSTDTAQAASDHYTAAVTLHTECNREKD